MGDRSLPPEAALDLQIHLDNVRRLEDQCREGLRNLAIGRLSRGAYLGLLARHEAAHEAWRSRHRKYFAEL
jgi:hypothetical protein